MLKKAGHANSGVNRLPKATRECHRHGACSLSQAQESGHPMDDIPICQMIRAGSLANIAISKEMDGTSGKPEAKRKGLRQFDRQLQ